MPSMSELHLLFFWAERAVMCPFRFFEASNARIKPDGRFFLAQLYGCHLVNDVRVLDDPDLIAITH